jgi:RNA polymerase sigma-70 factor, ECF subfamily
MNMAGQVLSVASRRLIVETERALVARAQRGEEEAFRALFEAHKSRVYSLCLRMTGNTADAEDLTQEAFLKVFRRISSFRGVSAFSTWLHRLAKNEVLMYLRKKQLLEVPIDEADSFQEQRVARQYRDEDRRQLGTLYRIDLNRAIAHLPQGCRTVAVLHELAGFKHREIAGLTNRSVGNSKAQLHKARAKLRLWFKPAPWTRGAYKPGASVKWVSPR